MSFRQALNEIEAQAQEISNLINIPENKGIYLQMGQIITRGPYKRSKAILDILKQDFTLQYLFLRNVLWKLIFG